MYSTVAKSTSFSAKVAPAQAKPAEEKMIEMATEETKGSSSQRVDREWLNLLEDNPRVKWCFDNKEAILALHSSDKHTKVFEMYCDSCERYFKHCMFSKNERKGWSHSILCRWCQAEMGIGTDPQQFSIDLHVHCNRGGKKECGSFPYHSLETPPTVNPPESPRSTILLQLPSNL
ncbi:hypothetical protein BDZ45DRAFT_745434 [Acephala macrosclerotiorum]|nr:hypothetical protein BDZ45DRAFT_745434 [Acephala macrosclerotiorum]